MFRKMAIALVAASVFTAPVLAQLSGEPTGKNQPGPSTPSTSGDTTEKGDKADKTEKSAETIEKTEKTTKHRRVAHHRRHHGGKAAKMAKSRTVSEQPGIRAEKYTKSEKTRMGHGRAPKQVYGKASKRAPSKTMSPH